MKKLTIIIITLNIVFCLFFFTGCVQKANQTAIAESRKSYPLNVSRCSKYYFNSKSVCIELSLTKEEENDILSSTKLMKEEYVNRIFEKWKVEDSLLSTNQVFKSLLMLTINKDGALEKYEVIMPSDSREFDESIKTAISKCIPFLQFDDEINQQVLKVALSFTNKKL